MTEVAAPTAGPYVSVVVLARRGGAHLRGCVSALVRQSLPASDFEIVVVDDGAAGDVGAALAALGARPVPRVVRCAAGEGRAAGVRAAAGEFCLLLGEHTIAHPALAAEHLRAQRAGRGVVGVGRLAPRLRAGAHPFARYCADEAERARAQLDRGQRPVSFTDCSAHNLSAPRSALAALAAARGLDDDLAAGAGVGLAYRLHLAGLPLAWVAEGRAEERHGASFRAAAGAVEAEGAAAMALYRRHPPLLPLLRLGAFTATTRRSVPLRRALLAARVPPRLLSAGGALLGRAPGGRPHAVVYDHCYWSGVRRAAPDRDTWQRLTRGPVILMYHAVGAAGEPARHYVVPARAFAWQMVWLARRGYRVLPLGELVRCLREHRLPPARSVVITFDDGYADNRDAAAPELRRRGFPATIFLVSDLVGEANRWDAAGELAGRPLLSWADARALERDGIAFGAHSRRHASLTSVDAGRLAEEVAGSRQAIDGALGHPTETFAYPFGHFDAATAAAVERAGFLGACCSRSGVVDPATPLFALPRVEVRGTDSLRRFALCVWLGRRRVA